MKNLKSTPRELRKLNRKELRNTTGGKTTAISTPCPMNDMPCLVLIGKTVGSGTCLNGYCWADVVIGHI